MAESDPTQHPFRAPWWLPGGHAQTIYAALAAPRPRVAYRRERWDTPDGDFIDIDWLAEGTSGTCSEAAPLVVLFHGLEGCSRSHYALSLMHALSQRGWRGAVAHFRGCSGEANRLPRAYHSGDSAEIAWILQRMHERAQPCALYAAGVSLGGNALLKWAGEQGARAQERVRAIAAVSVPMHLAAAGDELARGFNRLYTRWFLRTMKPKAKQKYDEYRPAIEISSILQANTMREYDNAYTAPMHGFRDVDDYWQRSSAAQFLNQISVPSLLLHAQNDPFLPARLLGTPQVSASVKLEMSATGGHVGFVSGAFPGKLDWLPQRVLRFFDLHR